MTLAFRSALGSSLLLAALAEAKTIEIKIENMKFDPPNATASAGDTVTWINKDLFPHTATGTARGTFDTKSIDAGKSASIKVKKKGHFEYKCVLHPTMLGTLDVR